MTLYVNFYAGAKNPAFSPMLVFRAPHAVLRSSSCRHGGRCLGPGDIGRVSRLQQALRSAGVKLETAATDAAALDAHDSDKAGGNEDHYGGGGGCGGGGGRDESEDVGGSGPSPPMVPCSSSSRPSLTTMTGASIISGSGSGSVSAPGGSCGTVMVVGKHGHCPWTSLASYGFGGGGSGGHGCDSEDESEGVRVVLETEAKAEVVSLLWMQACHRCGELRRPGSCAQAFRPQPWSIRTFAEIAVTRPTSSSAKATSSAAAACGNKGAAQEWPPAIAVRRFRFG